MGSNFHESLDRPEMPLPSDRSTGLVFTAVALIVAAIWRSNEVVLAVALTLAAAFATVSFVAPGRLRPLNVLWMRFAVLLSKIVNPVVMLILFAIAIVPTGLIMQRVRDPLRKRKIETPTYWIAVDQVERARTSNMKQQF